jgi:cobalt-zinc-cadmium efflux system outer membrane protein
VRDTAERPVYDVARLTALALEHRPDLRAAGAARTAAQAELEAARREILPDLALGAAYTHSDFTIAGDNPNTVGVSLALPLPLFDRNQAGVGRAQLDIRRAENEGARLRVEVARDVAEAVRRATRATTLLRAYEGGDESGGTKTATRDTGGMLARAETALRVAERSYRAGAASLLDLLEAQRTFLQTSADYLRALHDFRQAQIDVTHAVGEGSP